MQRSLWTTGLSICPGSLSTRRTATWNRDCLRVRQRQHSFRRAGEYGGDAGLGGREASNSQKMAAPEGRAGREGAHVTGYFLLWACLLRTAHPLVSKVVITPLWLFFLQATFSFVLVTTSKIISEVCCFCHSPCVTLISSSIQGLSHLLPSRSFFLGNCVCFATCHSVVTPAFVTNLVVVEKATSSLLGGAQCLCECIGITC